MWWKFHGSDHGFEWSKTAWDLLSYFFHSFPSNIHSTPHTSQNTQPSKQTQPHSKLKLTAGQPKHFIPTPPSNYTKYSASYILSKSSSNWGWSKRRTVGIAAICWRRSKKEKPFLWPPSMWWHYELFWKDNLRTVTKKNSFSFSFFLSFFLFLRASTSISTNLYRYVLRYFLRIFFKQPMLVSHDQ